MSTLNVSNPKQGWSYLKEDEDMTDGVQSVLSADGVQFITALTSILGKYVNEIRSSSSSVYSKNYILWIKEEINELLEGCDINSFGTALKAKVSEIVSIIKQNDPDKFIESICSSVNELVGCLSNVDKIKVKISSKLQDGQKQIGELVVKPGKTQTINNRVETVLKRQFRALTSITQNFNNIRERQTEALRNFSLYVNSTFRPVVSVAKRSVEWFVRLASSAFSVVSGIIAGAIKKVLSITKSLFTGLYRGLKLFLFSPAGMLFIGIFAGVIGQVIEDTFGVKKCIGKFFGEFMSGFDNKYGFVNGRAKKLSFAERIQNGFTSVLRDELDKNVMYGSPKDVAIDKLIEFVNNQEVVGGKTLRQVISLIRATYMMCSPYYGMFVAADKVLQHMTGTKKEGDEKTEQKRDESEELILKTIRGISSKSIDAKKSELARMDIVITTHIQEYEKTKQNCTSNQKKIYDHINEYVKKLKSFFVDDINSINCQIKQSEMEDVSQNADKDRETIQKLLVNLDEKIAKQSEPGFSGDVTKRFRQSVNIHPSKNIPKIDVERVNTGVLTGLDQIGNIRKEDSQKENLELEVDGKITSAVNDTTNQLSQTIERAWNLLPMIMNKSQTKNLQDITKGFVKTFQSGRTSGLITVDPQNIQQLSRASDTTRSVQVITDVQSPVKIEDLTKKITDNFNSMHDNSESIDWMEEFAKAQKEIDVEAIKNSTIGSPQDMGIVQILNMMISQHDIHQAYLKNRNDLMSKIIIPAYEKNITSMKLFQDPEADIMALQVGAEMQRNALDDIISSIDDFQKLHPNEDLVLGGMIVKGGMSDFINALNAQLFQMGIGSQLGDQLSKITDWVLKLSTYHTRDSVFTDDAFGWTSKSRESGHREYITGTELSFMDNLVAAYQKFAQEQGDKLRDMSPQQIAEEFSSRFGEVKSILSSHTGTRLEFGQKHTGKKTQDGRDIYEPMSLAVDDLDKQKNMGDPYGIDLIYEENDDKYEAKSPKAKSLKPETVAFFSGFQSYIHRMSIDYDNTPLNYNDDDPEHISRGKTEAEVFTKMLGVFTDKIQNDPQFVSNIQSGSYRYARHSFRSLDEEHDDRWTRGGTRFDY